MDLFAKILILITFVIVWIIASLLIVLFNPTIFDDTYNEYQNSKLKELYFLKLALEGPFVLLRLLKKK